jgi:hypothetical protein
MATATLNGATQNGHGGARAGAGRKPKALRYASELADAENKLMSALPDVIDGLVSAAKAGDVSAAKYLLDRVFGRVQLQSAAIADDTAIPFSEADVEVLETQATARRQHDTTFAALGIV